MSRTDASIQKQITTKILLKIVPPVLGVLITWRTFPALAELFEMTKFFYRTTCSLFTDQINRLTLDALDVDLDKEIMALKYNKDIVIPRGVF